MLEGLGCHHKTLANGRRQIIGYMIAGDICDLYAFLLSEADHDLAAVSDCRIVDITPERVREMMERPSLWRALWCATMVDEAILRAWIVNLGARNAAERIAHFFCEIMTRMSIVGLVKNNTSRLPLTQAMLAETCGLSVVHTNRSLQELRKAKLIDFEAKSLRISDFDRLANFASFDPRYLHLRQQSPLLL